MLCRTRPKIAQNQDTHTTYKWQAEFLLRSPQTSNGYKQHSMQTADTNKDAENRTHDRLKQPLQQVGAQSLAMLSAVANLMIWLMLFSFFLAQRFYTG